MVMRLAIISQIFAACAFCQPYTISTIAGTERVLDGSAAITVPLRDPAAVAVDPAGNVYIADRTDARIEK
jgi:hypothetical protein